MAAAHVDINTEAGADFGPWTFQWCEDGPVVDGEVTPGAPVDLSDPGWTAELQVREKRSPTSTLYLTVTHLEDNEILLDEDPVNGQITVQIPGDKTEGILKTSAQYDLKLISPEGQEFFVVYGKVTNRINVTVDA